MSKQPRVATDPELLKPIIEAVIFASEEPLSPRALIRLLAGEKESEPPAEASMPLDFSAEEKKEAAERMEESEERREEGSVIDASLPAAVTVEEDGGSSMEDGAMVGATEEDAATGNEGNDSGGREEEGVEGGEADGDTDAEREAMEVEGDGADLADAMDRVEGRVGARQFRPADGTLDQAYLRALIDELNDEYLQSGRAFRIVEVAGGFQFATIREYGEFVAMLSKDKARRKLSPAALETLAIIAYRQPVSKPEVEAIRGVNCDQVLLNLMEKNLIAITGRSEAVGRPLLYGTTEDFLRSFGLKGLGDLPKLREIEELMEEDAYSAERAEVITVDENTDVAELEAQIGAAGYAAEENGEESLEDGEKLEDGEELEDGKDLEEGDEMGGVGDHPSNEGDGEGAGDEVAEGGAVIENAADEVVRGEMEEPGDGAGETSGARSNIPEEPVADSSGPAGEIAEDINAG